MNLCICSAGAKVNMCPMLGSMLTGLGAHWNLLCIVWQGERQADRRTGGQAGRREGQSASALCRSCAFASLFFLFYGIIYRVLCVSSTWRHLSANYLTGSRSRLHIPSCFRLQPCEMQSTFLFAAQLGKRQVSRAECMAGCKSICQVNMIDTKPGYANNGREAEAKAKAKCSQWEEIAIWIARLKADWIALSGKLICILYKWIYIASLSLVIRSDMIFSSLYVTLLLCQ